MSYHLTASHLRSCLTLPRLFYQSEILHDLTSPDLPTSYLASPQHHTSPRLILFTPASSCHHLVSSQTRWPQPVSSHLASPHLIRQLSLERCREANVKKSDQRVYQKVMLFFLHLPASRQARFLLIMFL